MPKQNLVVVESAAKARTIEKFLGRNYTVRACLGHVRDLPTSRLGVDVEHQFEPNYVVPKDRKDVVKRLKDEARGKTSVLLATDPDREGEAIAWHLVSALGLDGAQHDQQVSRIEFHEVTRGAVMDALNNPRTIDMHRVDAQQARRVLDRLIGYPVSTFLGRKIRRGLSAGRVQSVAVRMVVDREREILAFVPVEYWTLQAELSRHQSTAKFLANLVERAGDKIDLKTGVEAQTVQADLDGARWTVAGVREREQQRHPDAPFTTSTLQQEASRKLGFSARRTMVVAQQLYEGIDIGGESVGLITYMRTDSVNVAQTALDEAREYIRTKLEKGMLPSAPRAYRTRSKLAQEAHEAIRPTSVFREPEALRSRLEGDQYRLYDLVWKRFLASQMASAVFDVTSVDVDAQGPSKPMYRFRASGSRLKFAGFLSLYRAGRDDEEPSDEDRQPLPQLTAGDLLDLARLIPEQHFTQPPPRYTEATLVKALEERGIGRPSTYAPILGTIQDRGYVERDGRRLKPTELGMTVNDVLVQQFEDIMDPDFTAILEDKLDEVAQGERRWVPVVQEFYEPLTRDLERANTEVERIRPAEIPTDEVCSEGHPMVIKEGRFGRFLACSKYPEHKETRPLPEELPKDAPDEFCSHGVKMQLRTGRFGPFYTSTHDCGETKPFARRVGVLCPTDGGEILEKRSKKGRIFYGCGNWPNCDWVSFNRPLQEPCPECGGLQVDMGRGRVRCLKHEGEPPRFAARQNGAASTADGKASPRRRTTASARTNGKATRSATSARTNGKAAASPRSSANGKAAASPRSAANSKAPSTRKSTSTRAR
ncbi:MAG: type I DNA topoisomerase [Chloroflexi bacterium]|nr:type I DNA topoisomerase [Chloroflexota bacterium]MBV9599448.1 type I DNA topoisomerase [Chloroflexota bacterium]